MSAATTSKLRLASQVAMAAIGVAGFGAMSHATETASAHTYTGKAVAIGHGTARIVVRSDASDTPTAIAVEMTEGVLKGLPSDLNKKTLPEGDWGYVLSMPSKGPKTGIDHVEIDWNPQGHPPPHVYTVPHFDFHFYAISRAAQAKIKFKGADDPGAKAPEAALLPPDYKFIPETAVPDMGVHAIDMTSPEFHGKPFTATFIYGYYQGQLTFVEPMVTRAFLLTKPDMTRPVKAPAQYSLPGHYPTSYSVKYDAAKKVYAIELGGLKAGPIRSASAGD